MPVRAGGGRRGELGGKRLSLQLALPVFWAELEFRTPGAPRHSLSIDCGWGPRSLQLEAEDGLRTLGLTLWSDGLHGGKRAPSKDVCVLGAEG